LVYPIKAEKKSKETLMLKVLLVDDEEIIIRGLKVLTDWESLGFTIVGEAYDGEEALKAAATLRPDVIITDIRMPVVDGLSMIGKVREFLPETLLLILSGYGDFSYAQEALDKGAFAYLLKPVTAQVLEQKMLEVKKRLLDQRRKGEQLHKLYHMRSPARDAYFSKLVHQGDITPRELERAWSLFELGNPPDAAAVVLFYAPLENDPTLKFAVGNVLEEMTTERQMGFCFDYATTYAVLLAQGDDRQTLREALPLLCLEIQQTVERILSIRLSIGIGGVCDAPNLSRSFHQGLLALEQMFLEKGRVYAFDDMAKKLPFSLDTENLAARLFDQVGARDLTACQETSDTLFAAFRDAAVDKPFIARVYQELFADLKHRLVTAFSELRSDAVVSSLDKINWNAFEDYKALHGHYMERMERIIAIIRMHTASQSVQLVGKIKAYVQSHYADANREDVAKEFFINPSYLSQVFKQVEGCGFSEYLTNVRVQKGKELLISTDYKIQLIAEKVGYTSSQHFGRVFEKSTGVLPFDYRRAHQA
jgi:two-component system response regulator YesN